MSTLTTRSIWFSLTALLLCSRLQAADGPSADQLLVNALNALGGQQSGLEITAKGWDACLGQAWSVKEGWARWELTDYRRTLDYKNGGTKHTALRRPAMDAGKIGGCGAQPNGGAAPQQSLVDGNSPWADQLVLWLTPQGFLQLFASTGKQAITRDGKGTTVLIPILRDEVTYPLSAHINSSNEIDLIRTRLDDPIFGDMQIEVEFGPYKQFGSVRFPGTWVLKQGGFPTLSLTIENAVATNDTVINTTPRRAAAPAPAPAAPFTSIGKGIYAIAGAYQSVAVEFEQFSVVIDGLQNDARVQDLIANVKKAIPNKPIRYVVSTHSHNDHANGLRQFAAEGATIITHEMNREFLRNALNTPRTLRIKPTEPNTVQVKLQTVKDRFVIEDKAGQRVEIYALGPSPHAADMLIAWLPSISTVVEADILQPWISPQFGGKNGPHPMLNYLDAELKKLKLTVKSFVPVHVPPQPPLMQRADLDAALQAR